MTMKTLLITSNCNYAHALLVHLVYNQSKDSILHSRIEDPKLLRSLQSSLRALDFSLRTKRRRTSRHIALAENAHFFRKEASRDCM